MSKEERKESEERWLSPPQVAQMLPEKPSAETVRNWAAAGKLPGARRTPGNRWLIPESAVRVILEGGV
ncbi:helix-turn-helix domain-containing protein [Corynebacterium senegalense]|uniref:helix-turn-helix domain-containing protein n=1 Tax=Corynebacterium senegalense TaxID=2080750 RepID=UPI000E208B04